jgi:hypothetical protein
MPLNIHRVRAWFGRVVVAGIMLGGAALFAGAPSAKANDWDDCDRQIARANWQLHEAIEDDGYRSPQANYWRHELHEAYERQEHLRREFREEQWREHEWSERRDYDRHYYYRDRDDHWYEHDRGRDRHQRRDNDDD